MELTEKDYKNDDNSVQNEPRSSQAIQSSPSFIYKTHAEQLYETFSVQSLAQWIVRNGQKVDKLLRRNEKTFIDNKGIKRYAHNWQRYVELSEEAEAEQLFEKTGCVRLNLEYQLRGKHKIIKGQKEVDMLNDWQRLWLFLLTDEEDEIAIHAPLLRQSVEFCFHPRTCHIMIGLTGYSVICYLIPLILYPRGNLLMHNVSSFSSLFVILVVYLACLALMKGNSTAYSYIFGSSKNPPSIPSNQQQANFEKKVVDQSYSVHWTASVKQYYYCARQEYHRYLQPTETQIAITRAQKIQKSISFYRVLNMSLKMLTRYDQIDTKLSNFDRSSYRLILLFIAYFLPLYIYFYGNVFLFNFSLYDCFHDYHGQPCQSSILYLALSVAYITRAATQYIFGSSVLVTLVSLAYGGEACFQLIHTWLKKFRSLRRVKETDQSCKVIPYTVKEVTIAVNTNTKATDPSVVEDKATVHSPFAIHSINTTNEGVEEKLEEFWNFDNESMLEYIKRDATEHYLLIREIVNISSEIWSPALTGFFFLIFYSIFAFLVVFIMDSSLTIIGYVIFVIYVIVRIVVLLLYPIYSISHANAYLYEIKGMFEKSALDDFLILGGREHWIALVEACPIVWTYYGLWVTYDRLQGLLYTSFVGLVATIASLLSASPLFASASDSVR